MDDIEISRILLEVERFLSTRADPRMGRITSYDPVAHTVKVAVLPEADFPVNEGDVSETGWIPLSPVCAGNGWGIYAPPAIGTQVMLNHQEASHGAPIAISTINDQNNPPPAVPAGETWVVHKTGSFIKLTNDGNIAISTPNDLTISVVGNANVSAEGSMTITATGTVNLLSADQINLGAIGGKKVVRDGDPTVKGDTVIATSETVFSA